MNGLPYQRWLSDMVSKYDLERDEIRDLLKKHFGGFKSSNKAQMEQVIQEEVKQRKERELLNKKLDHYEGRDIITPETCPFHEGAKLYGTVKWGRKARDGFTCSEGGIACYLRWKMEKATGQSYDWSIFDGYQAWFEEHGGTTEEYVAYVKEQQDECSRPVSS